ncbi:MbtH family protein [Spongiactinospora sp. 9N601]|uniref:MbtH family protein n=1 Tax=Spongiactinospora sp. 9N601 TaxID=3375149 RepID=UPI0037ADA38D
MSSLLGQAGESCLVVVNEEGQHSLWPQVTAPPAGWTPVYGPAGRAQCLAYVEEHWTDMRPLGLVTWLADEAAAAAEG